VNTIAESNSHHQLAPHRPARKPSLLSILAVSFGILVLGAMAYRLRYGIAYTDEPFYTAMPYRFVLGDRPFFDEYNISQTLAFITFPLVYLYTHIANGTTGIVLFMRCCYLLLMLLTSACIFSYARRQIPWPVALVASLISLVFAPWGIQSLGYNAMGGALLTISLFLTLWSVSLPDKRVLMVVAGIAGGLCIVSYPTMTIPVGMVILAMWRIGSLRTGKRYLLGVGLVLVPFCGYLATVGIPQLLLAYKFTQLQHAYVGAIAQLWSVTLELAKTAILEPILALFMIVLILSRFIHRSGLQRMCGFMTLTVPFAVVPVLTYYAWARSNGAFVCLALIGASIWLFRRDVTKRTETLLVVAPSLTAGLTATFTSGNGYLNASVGLLPVAAITLIWLYRVTENSFIHIPRLVRISPYYALLSIAGIVGVVGLLQYRAFYDQPGGIAPLSQYIPTGPFAGIYASPQNASLIVNLQRDVLRLSRPGDRILFFDGFPAGYLLTDLRPATDTVWTFSPYYTPDVDSKALIQYFQKNHILPSIVVRVVSDAFPYRPNYPITNLVLSRQYKLVLSDAQYTIYRLVPSGSPVSESTVPNY
jgi:hypothetical protein